MGKALLNLPANLRFDEPPNINEMHIWKFVFVVSSYILGVSPGRELQMLSPCRKPPPTYIVQEHDIGKTGGKALHPPVGFWQEVPLAVEKVYYCFWWGGKKQKTAPVYIVQEHDIGKTGGKALHPPVGFWQEVLPAVKKAYYCFWWGKKQKTAPVYIVQEHDIGQEWT